MPHVILSNANKELIAELYAKSGKTVDDLPYTDEFDQLHTAFVSASGRDISKHDFWRALSSGRKASRLVRKQR